MEVIILAGGKGTRLREAVADLPKPMADIKGKPFLYYLLEWLTSYPVEKIVMSVGYKADCIINYFGKSFQNIPIEYILEEKPLGTGGAIVFAMRSITGNDLLIINGDTYFPVDLNRFSDLHHKSRSLLSVALKPMLNFSRYGTVVCNGEKIIRFEEKKVCAEGLINGGIYFLNKTLLSNRHLPEVFSFEKEVLEKDAGTEGLKGFIFDTTFIDIGIPEDYYRAGSVLLDNAEEKKF